MDPIQVLLLVSSVLASGLTMMCSFPCQVLASTSTFLTSDDNIPPPLDLAVRVDGIDHTITLEYPKESVRSAVQRFGRSAGEGLAAGDLLTIERACHLQIADNLEAIIAKEGNLRLTSPSPRRLGYGEQGWQAEYEIFREGPLPAEFLIDSSTSPDFSSSGEQLGRLLQYANAKQGTSAWIEKKKNKQNRRIPKHMHFIWTGGQQELDRFEANLDPSDKRQRFNQWRQTCLDLHPAPAWKHTLWDLVSMRQLVQNEFAWMLPQYDAIDVDIKRTDLARLLILIHHGGVYVDIDFECLRPFDNDLVDPSTWQVVLSEHQTNLPQDHKLQGRELPNAFMASVPHHPLIWVIAVEVLRRDALNPGGYVTHVTGPHVFSEIVFGYLNEFPTSTVHILPIDVLFPVYCLDKEDMRKDAECVVNNNCAEVYDKSLAVHHYAASWYETVMQHMNRPRLE